MKFKPVHENYNVRDLDRSIEFYGKALGLKETRRINAEDGSFIIVYLGSEKGGFQLELTWLRDFECDYNLGDNEFHLALKPKIMPARTHCTKAWDVSVTRILRWGYTSYRIRTGTGLR